MLTQPRKILVYGANGVQGGAIARRLIEEGFAVRGAVRDPSKSAPLVAAGVELVTANLDDARALRAAHQDVEAVVVTLPLEWNRETVLRWTQNAVRAAREGEVSLVVLNAGTRIPTAPSDVPSFELRREVEGMLKDSGVPSIHLRPPLFMENLRNPSIARAMVHDRTVAYPLPESFRVSWLAAADLGGFVAAALRRPDLIGRSLDVGGPQALAGPELAAELARALGFPLHYAAIPPQVFERGLAQQFGADVAAGISRTYYYCAAYATSELLSGAAPELASSLSRPPLSVAEWARCFGWP